MMMMSNKINGRDIDKIIIDDELLIILEANKLLNASYKIKETHEDKVLKEVEYRMKSRGWIAEKDKLVLSIDN